MIGFIIGLLIIGLIAGALARLLVPGKQNLSIPGTALLGVVGSFVGGFLGDVLFNHDAGSGLLQTSGLFGSVIGAVIALLVYTKVINKSVTTRR